jgi:hypothetical protein
VSQIRRQLQMTVPERVRSMVEAANTMLAIQKHAQASLRSEAELGVFVDPSALVAAPSPRRVVTGNAKTQCGNDQAHTIALRQA